MSKRITYFDSRYTLDNEEFLDYCGRNEYEPSYGLLSEFIEQDRNDLYENLRFCIDGEFLMQGTIGRWDGTANICPLFGELYDLVIRAIDSGDDAVVYLEDGILYVNAFHHDGTNKFYIRPVVDNFRDLHEEYIGDDLLYCDDVKEEELQKFGEYLY